jgi:hypothetical protein
MGSFRIVSVGASLAALALVAVAAAGASRPAVDQAPPAEVRRAAQAGLGALLGAGGIGGNQRLGFPKAADAAEATIGDGVQVYTLPPDRILDPAEADVQALAVPTTLWQFIVVNGSAPRAVLTVDRMKGEWTAVSLGASGLADQLTAMLGRWPLSSCQLRLIRVYQANADVMEIAKDGTVIGYVPFLSARIALGAPGPFDPGDVWDGADVVGRLRPVVRAALGRR